MATGRSDSPGDAEAAAPAPDRADRVEAPLPEITPPQTKVGVQLNQQYNVSIQSIPTTAWDRLTPAQIVEVTRVIVEKADESDRRHFEYAMESVKQEECGKKRALIVGAVISIVAYGAAGWLGLDGHEIVAAIIALPLATVLAMIVGNRFLE